MRSFAERVVEANPLQHPVEAVYRAVQALPYRYDEEILAQRGIGSDTSELLQGAPYQVASIHSKGPERTEGDCDDRAILVQSLLESLGYQTSFVLVRGPDRPDYSHVYSEVELGGTKVPLDTIFNGTHGRAFYAPGDEPGAELGARDRISVPVEGSCGGASLLLLAAFAAFLLGRRT